MATIREKALSIVSKARTKLVDQKAGMRRYTLYLRRMTPSDVRGGIGATWTTVDTLISEKPRVRSASQKDIVAGAGRVQVGDFVIDKITPRNDANTLGTAPSTLDLTPNSAGQKVFYVLVGPGMPAYVAAVVGPPAVQASGGGLFTPVHVELTKNFQFEVILRPATGKV